MKRIWVSVLMALLLCLVCVPAMAAKIKIPATAEEALKKLPMKLPEVTVTRIGEVNEGIAFAVTGLDQLPLQFGKRYVSGWLKYNPYASVSDGLVAMKGHEDEPLTIVLPKNEDISGPNFVTNKKKLKGFKLIMYPFRETTGARYSFDKDVTFQMYGDGSLDSYRFKSGKYSVMADYGTDGVIESYSISTDSMEVACDANGRMLSASYTEKQDRYYVFYCENGFWMEYETRQSCEEPAGFTKELPEVELYPAETVTLTAAREAEIKQRIYTGEGAPLPVCSMQETEDGGLLITLTGADLWGVKTQQTGQYEDNSYMAWHNPELPAGTVTYHIPPQWVEQWTSKIYSRVLLERIYAGIIPSLVLEDETWYLEFQCDEGWYTIPVQMAE